MIIRLRLDRIVEDDVGTFATFYGKPDIHSNCISMPVSEYDRYLLKVGKQYDFYCTLTPEDDDD